MFHLRVCVCTNTHPQPGIGLWAAERLLRILRLVVLNRLWRVIPTPCGSNLPSSATLTLLTPSTLKLSFPRTTLSWSAGQHFYVVMPGMSRLPWEAHPFTAATTSSCENLEFIVRVRDGFTKRMKERVDEERKALGLGLDDECSIQVKAAVEGPYGGKRSLSSYEAVLILAGGSGVSFAISHLLQIIEEAKAGRSRIKNVQIVWMVKSKCACATILSR